MAAVYFPAGGPGTPVSAWIGLGANLGDARAALLGALDAMAQWPGSRLLRVSSLYRSAPVDAGGPDYWNAVAELATPLAAIDLLHALQAIEQAAGRERPYRNAPRTLDLDVLLYGDERIDTSELTVPHPRMGERAFVLQPLAEIAPGRVEPARLATVQSQRIERLGPFWP
ncbi:2-amino-4-hydroxy-6-hydroxymethyldihydropteridine diphosphokinase [Acidovorax sp. SUPP2522]|uniref:2-amino-4-hydroxy-6- hydroxymethyldihydropteridine diphosphokinase n=1 Tax=unclassified Acidovorax TaxID=2684926 RepID=UPI00234B126B|nr:MULTISPECIES: 2-amino-4-hydroxy-6-hydroxymethyldihydropteridine diphosphokinase [unclassified Acidovorax]WCM96291.1 2-amino-4-hydroxy-6-hydroxymethyldihydropteridine diphosphokinase [Acidovorax sp. GBBC 1281]GKT16949.1 2-amino-4-hydroxy-6-hydroxymethyldihydropteridine diphosphokinase [Acidovorax sp. SUPP2522]